MSEKFILVPLDGSKIAENAVAPAARIATATGLPVRFAHIVSSSEGLWKEDDLDDARDNFVPYAQGLARGAGLDVPADAVEVKLGDPAKEILDLAEDAAYVVIATHGRGGFRATFIGSVADKVVRGAEVPVLAIPGIGPTADIADANTILIALDGSAASERGLVAGRALAKGLGAKVVLLQAYNMPPAIGVEFAYFPGDYLTKLEEGAREYLAAKAEPGEEQRVLMGWPAGVIVDQAKELNAGIVVMAKGGGGFWRRVTIGSTTANVLHSLERPLLVVPMDD